jgi:hypothetical protein
MISSRRFLLFTGLVFMGTTRPGHPADFSEPIFEPVPELERILEKGGMIAGSTGSNELHFAVDRREVEPGRSDKQPRLEYRLWVWKGVAETSRKPMYGIFTDRSQLRRLPDGELEFKLHAQEIREGVETVVHKALWTRFTLKLDPTGEITDLEARRYFRGLPTSFAIRGTFPIPREVLFDRLHPQEPTADR